MNSPSFQRLHDRLLEIHAERPDFGAALDLQRNLLTRELELVEMFLAGGLPRLSLPGRYLAAKLKDGIPATQATIKGDERMLLGLATADRDAVLLNYVGKKTIAKLACAGCHDIPGFEDAKPAGAATPATWVTWISSTQVFLHSPTRAWRSANAVDQLAWLRTTDSSWVLTARNSLACSRVVLREDRWPLRSFCRRLSSRTWSALKEAASL